MKKKSLLITVFSLFIFLCLLFLFFLFTQCKIQKIIIISPSSEIYGFEIMSGKNLVLINTVQFTEYLIKRNPKIKSATIEKIFPHTLRIDLQEREPVAYIKDSLHTFSIDIDGVLLPFEENTGNKLPVIKAEDTIFLATEKTDWRLIKALSILDKMRKESIYINQIVIDKDKSNFYVYLDPSIEVIIPFDSNPQIMATSLQVIVARFRIEGKFISKVDFQFDKPIVILRNEENISSH